MLTVNTGIRAGDLSISHYEDATAARMVLKKYPDIVVVDITVVPNGSVYITTIRQ